MSVICQYVKFIAYHQEIDGSKTWWSKAAQTELVLGVIHEKMRYLSKSRHLFQPTPVQTIDKTTNAVNRCEEVIRESSPRTVR